MSFTKARINMMTKLALEVAGDLMQPCKVDPYRMTSVTVEIGLGTRGSNERDITAGANADVNMVATINAEDWDAQVGRAPQKGDVIWWGDTRYAVQTSHLVAPGGVKSLYKARLEG